jgi:2-dehydro-3-deoxygluconokinase
VSPAPYVLTFGETMALMRADQVGPLAHASTMSLGIGGSESNVAIGLQRLGVQAVWCGRIGADSLGQLVEREIRAEGVDVRIAVDPSAPTGLMIKERRTPDAQRVSYYRAGSAGSRIASTDIDEQLIAEAGLLHVSGITPALSAQAEATLRHAIDVARTAGVPVSFDLNFRGNLWSAEGAGSVYRDIIPLADIVFAGEDEAAIAVGAGEPEDLARRIADLGPGQAVIKLGADGALALIDGTVFRQPAVPVSVVDTVGAGDAFVAGYLAELMEGRGPRSASAPPRPPAPSPAWSPATGKASPAGTNSRCWKQKSRSPARHG